jgi:hypothetical protein
MDKSINKEHTSIVAEIFLFLVLTAGLLCMVIYWK